MVVEAFKNSVTLSGLISFLFFHLLIRYMSLIWVIYFPSTYSVFPWHFLDKNIPEEVRNLPGDACWEHGWLSITEVFCENN